MQQKVDDFRLIFFVAILYPNHFADTCCGFAPLYDAAARDDVLASDRITGGLEADPHRYPWQVMVYHTDVGLSCAGSLISNRFVLTSAECATMGNSDLPDPSQATLYYVSYVVQYVLNINGA